MKEKKNYMTEGIIIGFLAGAVLGVLDVISIGLGCGYGMLAGLAVGLLIPKKKT